MEQERGSAGSPGDMGGKITSPSYLKKVLQEQGLAPHRRMGQHFLIDENILQKIIAAARLEPGDHVLDIGAGPGALSLSLARQVSRVLAIEWDSGLAALLRREARRRGLENISVVEGDVRRLDLEETCRAAWGTQLLPPPGDPAGPDPAIKVVANLPYYLTTPLLFKLLRGALPLRHLVLMVQLEVARRIVASPATRDYGVLTLLCQYYTEPQLLFNVSRHVFYPPPAVDSAVIGLRPRAAPPVIVSDETLFWQVVDAAFGQRRKTVLNALEGTADLDREGWRRVLARAGVDPALRGETLSLERFAKISEMLYNK